MNSMDGETKPSIEKYMYVAVFNAREDVNASSAERIVQFRTNLNIKNRLFDGPAAKGSEPATL